MTVHGPSYCSLLCAEQLADRTFLIPEWSCVPQKVCVQSSVKKIVFLYQDPVSIAYKYTHTNCTVCHIIVLNSVALY